MKKILLDIAFSTLLTKQEVKKGLLFGSRIILPETLNSDKTFF
jgi:hypothetical protein